jgi:hypothetical protein
MGQVGGMERLQAIMASNLASELTGTQVVELVMRLGKGGLTVEKAKELMGDDKKMEEFVKNGLKKDPYLAIPAAGAYERYAARREGRAFSARVEYAQPPRDILLQAFDFVDDGYESAKFGPTDICKEVLVEAREVDFELVHLNKGAMTDTVLIELDKQGLRPALYEELLAFAVTHPDLQKRYTIIALGSICCRAEGISSSCVYAASDKLSLGFVWFTSNWLDDYRFLAVPK